LFADRLGQALALADRTGRRVAVLYIDIDRFKLVNDSLGHAVGDLLLRSIAHRLRQAMRAHDTVARLSGDEFAVIASDLESPAVAEQLARKLLLALREPHELEDQSLNVSSSVGLAVYPEDAPTHAALVRSADDAAYHAKQFRNTWQRYS